MLQRDGSSALQSRWREAQSIPAAALVNRQYTKATGTYSIIQLAAGCATLAVHAAAACLSTEMLLCKRPIAFPEQLDMYFRVGSHINHSLAATALRLLKR